MTATTWTHIDSTNSTSNNYRITFNGAAGGGGTGQLRNATTPGCNESLKYNNAEKAAFHGLKFPFRMLGLHSDTDDDFDPNPSAAARAIPIIARAYLEDVGESYDRQESHDYFEDNVVPNKILGNPSKLQIFEKGMEHAWDQIENKGNHADACRTALTAAERYLDQDL